MKLEANASLLGYGKSTARKTTEDYAQENINQGMLALLERLGRDKAVWIGTLFTHISPLNCLKILSL